MDNRAPEPHVATAKIIPPVRGAPVLDRPRLENLLTEVTSRRLTTVIADAGFGKSTLLGSWSSAITPAWYTVTPEDRSLPSFALGILAAVLSEMLYRHLKRDLVLILDDFHELGHGGASARVIDELCRQAPSTLHLVLAGRSELPFQIERLRGQGQVLEVTGAELTFTLKELEVLLRSSVDDSAVQLAPELQRVTGGGAAARRLTPETPQKSPTRGRAGRLAPAARRGGG